MMIKSNDFGMKVSSRRLCVSFIHYRRICRAKVARFADPLTRLVLRALKVHGLTGCRETILGITEDAPSHAKCLSEVATEDLRFRRESRPFLGKSWFGSWSLVCKYGCGSHSSRDGRPKTGDQPCRFLMCFQANRTPASFRR